MKKRMAILMSMAIAANMIASVHLEYGMQSQLIHLT